MKNTTTNAVSTPAIETKTAANGNINVYVNGKRVSNKVAVEIAEQNNLPVYEVNVLTSAGNSVSNYFVNALAAYKWYNTKARNDNNFACGSCEILRTVNGDRDVKILDFADNYFELNVDDEPEFATYIYATMGAEHINARYNRMVNFFNQLVKDGLTAEQAEQVITVQYENENGLEHCKLIKAFKKANAEAAKAEIDAAEYTVTAEAQAEAVNAEIENANANNAEVTTVEVETPATVEVEIGGKVQEFHHIDADTITNKNGSCTLKIYNTEYHNIPHSYELHSQICGLSDEVIIDMEIKTYGHDSANLLCKFIATTTDGSEDDADDNDEVFNLLPDFKAQRREEFKRDFDEAQDCEAEQLPMPKIITALYKNGRLTVKLDGRRVPLHAVEDALLVHRREPITVIDANGEIFTCTGHIKELRTARAQDAVKNFVQAVAKGEVFSDKQIAEAKENFYAAEYAISEEAMEVAVEGEIAAADAADLNALVKDATIAIAANYLQNKRNGFVKQLGNLNANKHLLTAAEFDAKAAELKGEIGYLDLHIAALNAGDTFDYAAAKTRIADEYEDLQNCVEFWNHEHGLTQEQAEAVYVAAHCDRNNDAELDRELINRMIDEFKQTNAAVDEPPTNNENLDAQKQTLIDEAETLDAKIQALEVNLNHEFDKYEVADEKFARAWFEPTSVKAALKAARDEQHAVVEKILAELTPLRERKKELTATIADLICRQMDNTPNDEPQGWIVPVEMPARKLSDLKIADLLTDRLYKVTNNGIFNGGNYMDLTLQNGKKTAGNVRTAIVEINWHGNGFVFITPWNEVYARYDTADEVAHVIELIGTAVKRGDTEFTYPANEPPTEYDSQKRAIDLDVYHVDSNLTDDELADYTSMLREALTANGNKGTVTCEDNFIAVIGNDGGDNKRLAELLNEMSERGCEVEVVDDEAAERSEMTGWEFDALAALGTNVPAESVDIPAPVTIEVPTPEFIAEPVKEFAFNVARFNDEFIAKRDKLKANFAAAQDALIAAQDNFDDAENALRKFFNKAAYELCNVFRNAQATLGDKTIIIERQCGLRRTVDKDTDIYIDVHGGEMFAFVDGTNKTVARYDTPAQVKAVIGKFAAAIQNGDKLFIFPTAEELNA